MEKKTGKIINLNKRGFGFIKPDVYKGINNFFYCNKVENARFKDLAVGDKVKFIEIETAKGTEAESVIVM